MRLTHVDVTVASDIDNDTDLDADSDSDTDADSDSDTDADSDTEGVAGPSPTTDVVFDDLVMVRLSDDSHDDDLYDIAVIYGATVEREVGLSGLGVLRVAGGQAPALVTALALEPAVAAIMPVAVASGAVVQTVDVSGYAWHLDQLGLPPAVFLQDGDSVRVAVLDTGLAYENATEGGRAYQAAPSLAHVEIRYPIDLVNGDNTPYDDHQHGTHIASLIASQGLVQGVASGVDLMPIKVLDKDNTGMEFDLVEGIWHAIDNNADVINLSLSFHRDYVPSQPLIEALDAADQADIVVIAAVGNDGSSYVSWPAAHCSVLAVGALGYGENNLILAKYSNYGGGVDLMAPGGELDVDLNSDLVLDGLVGETIGLQEPGDVGAWMFEGTSQAAAVVTGVAAQLISDGVPPEEVRRRLISGAMASWGSSWVHQGMGVGRVSYMRSRAIASGALPPRTSQVAVSILPVLLDLGAGSVAPLVTVAAFDETGAPLVGAQVLVSVRGASEESTLCTTSLDVDGAAQCMIEGPAVDLLSLDGPASWEVVATRVIDAQGGVHRPMPGLFVSDALDVLVEAIDAQPATQDATLAVRWEQGSVEGLGDVHDAYVVFDLASSGQSRSLIFTPDALPFGSTSTVTVNLNATRALDPLGIQRLTLIDFGGSGLLSSPMGFRAPRLLAFGGSGLLSSPMGLRPQHVFGGRRAPVVRVSGSSHAGGGVQLGQPTGDSGPLGEDTALGARVSSGGWSTSGGYGGASAVGGGRWVGVAATTDLGGSAADSVPFPIE